MKHIIQQVGEQLNQHVKNTYFKGQYDQLWEKQEYDHTYMFGLPLESDELLHFTIYLGNTTRYPNEDGSPSDALGLYIGLPYSMPKRKKVELAIFDVFTELVKKAEADTFIYLRGDLEQIRLFGGERPTGTISEEKYLLRQS